MTVTGIKIGGECDSVWSGPEADPFAYLMSISEIATEIIRQMGRHDGRAPAVVFAGPVQIAKWMSDARMLMDWRSEPRKICGVTLEERAGPVMLAWEV